MRALRAFFLILMVVLGQAHACRAVYVMADGQDCPTCPATACPENRPEANVSGSGVSGRSVAKAPSFAAKTRDCRACCRLTCREDERPRAVPSVRTMEPGETALLVPELAVPAPPSPVFETVTRHVATQFPNAPPCHRDSRAPPASFV